MENKNYVPIMQKRTSSGEIKYSVGYQQSFQEHLMCIHLAENLGYSMLRDYCVPESKVAEVRKVCEKFESEKLDLEALDLMVSQILRLPEK